MTEGIIEGVFRMNLDPRGFMNGLIPPFWGPANQNVLTGQGAINCLPYNVLNEFPISPGVKIGKSPSYGYGLPYELYNSNLTNPTQEELEKEYQKMMQSYSSHQEKTQKGKDQKKGEEKKEAKSSQSGQDKKSKSKESESGKKKKKPNAMISFDKLSAGTITSSSGIFNGKNIQFGWSAHSKTNNGFGTLGGNNNTLHNNLNVVFDNDQVDTPIDDRDIMWSPVPNPSI